ncbi:MAG: hypothetical protein R3321_10510, partial [Nitrososphaeraceae archaeon]|nr:hypothetical protein [Nitrososphaeraceae archaeon]
MKNTLPKNVKAYLSKRAADNWNLKWNKNEEIINAIIVPALAEFDNLKLLFNSLTENDNDYFRNTLVIIVVNNKRTEKEDYRNNNTKTINFLNKIIDENYHNDELINQIKVSGLQIGYVDASSSGFEMDNKNGGVGLARKIGMDEALKVFNYSNPGKKIMVCLD